MTAGHITRSLVIVGVAGVLSTLVGAQTLPSQLGLSESNARQLALDSLNAGQPVFGMAGKTFQALPAAVKVAVVNGGFLWMKAYANSAAFKTAYAESRERLKPTPPEPANIDQELKQKRDEEQKSIGESRAMLSALPADQRPAMEAILKQTEAMMKDPAHVKMLRDEIESRHASDREQYATGMKDWERDYPANPLVLVARRLQHFLDVSATVDFSARTVKGPDGTRFVNPEHQSKPAEWKMCYRAGKDAVDAARAQSAAWLKELPAR